MIHTVKAFLESESNDITNAGRRARQPLGLTLDSTTRKVWFKYFSRTRLDLGRSEVIHQATRGCDGRGSRQ